MPSSSSSEVNNSCRIASSGHSAASKYSQGAGLGLSIAKHLVELHGGNVEVASTVGKGSIFFFDLPISSIPTEKPFELSLPVTQVDLGKEDALPDSFVTLQKKQSEYNILVVDDVTDDLKKQNIDDLDYSELISKEEFLAKLSEKLDVENVGEAEYKPSKPCTFGMYLDGEWYHLNARDSVLASNSLSASVGDKLDVSILQNFLLNPILGIDDPRTNNRIDFIGGIRGTQELEKLVNSGKAAVAFSMYPVSVSDLMNISDAGEVMPPKSTWFEPKLRDGLLTHMI